MTDEKRLKRLLKNGSSADIEEYYEYLYYKYQPLLIFIASKYLSDFEDIEDVVQETFIDFYKHLDNDHTNIKAILSITCKHKAIDLLRKQKHIVIVSDEELDMMISNDNESHDTIVSHDTYKEIIKDLSTVLTSVELDIILRHLLYSESFKDIAKNNNTKESSIKSIYYRSIEKYKKAKRIK